MTNSSRVQGKQYVGGGLCDRGQNLPDLASFCESPGQERHVLSIESQTRELKELAIKLGLHVAEVLMESKSAKDPGRPVFIAMMQRLYRGEAAGIIYWKLDRLACNPVDGGSIIWAIKPHVDNRLKKSMMWYVFTPIRS
jgi:hypothetical protein